jgi:hypothetical protein
MRFTKEAFQSPVSMLFAPTDKRFASFHRGNDTTDLTDLDRNASACIMVVYRRQDRFEAVSSKPSVSQVANHRPSNPARF